MHSSILSIGTGLMGIVAIVITGFDSIAKNHKIVLFYCSPMTARAGGSIPSQLMARQYFAGKIR